ncbi:type 1 glutamine amidotransferase domain-containing protein [Candidatus Marimicrobium litorale]|jgi:putative intracellular protease/amidase|uniref:Type 1 glutamine amidotransferase domain-containing protein n=1 Tax=Candidatus Marimicrobium litorale TaxID=2518991 RepID=A0ABT3T4K1_9GAMM|nr:type 1 glutamine amidotransferase domain-containing protein [Candidatus Marimicrobium litorale]MCX2977100.1 type 1 glutamine amidotransferase domain-containing protein [Candidatus Marimicrobium litorale]
MKKLFTAFVVIITIAGITLLALPTILHKAGLHPEYNGPTTKLPGMRALIVTTSHDVLAAPGETEGPATGVMASEFTHPYYTFLDGGMEVDIASIEGGQIPIDPGTLRFPVKSPEDERYLNDPVAQAKVKNSIPIADVDIEQYDIVFLSGGWGAAYDLAQSPALAQKVSESYYGDKEAVIGGVCHGVLGLVNARARDGELLIAGRRMTGVTDKQIKELGIEMTPLHPETALREAGVVFENQSAFRDIFATHVTVDDEERFVTGQNQNSGLETSNVMMQVLAARTE